MREGGRGSGRLVGMGVSFWGDGNALELDSNAGYTKL